MAITRIAELPLPEREPLELLALAGDRLAPDHDYAGFGWAWVDAVELAAPDRPPVWLRRTLLLALHSADEQPEHGDIELLFELPDQSVLVPLSRWMPAALPGLPAADELVLVLCNPGRVVPALPPGLPQRRVHYALGDVTSWWDPDDDGGGHVRLSARRWCVAAPGPGDAR
jgi:hypothetical protein